MEVMTFGSVVVESAVATSASENSVLSIVTVERSENDARANKPLTESIVDTHKLLQMLDCVICTNSMYPPIYQCAEGHAFCEQCKQKLVQCPTCNCKNIDVRSRVLDAFIECVTSVGCRYEKYGCKEKMSYTEKQCHEKQCAFTPLLCLHYGVCRFEGTLNEITEHMLAKHSYEQHKTDKIDVICDRRNVDIVNGKEWIWQHMLFSCHGSHFVLRVKRNDEEVRVSVLSCHSSGAAHYFKLCIAGKNRECAYSSLTLPCSVGFRELERVNDCLIVRNNLAAFMCGGTGAEQSLDDLPISISGQIYPISVTDDNNNSTVLGGLNEPQR